MADPSADSPRGNNPEDAQRPDWLPENFTSPEALVTSYNEAQNKIREQGTRLNAVEQNFAELSSQFEQSQQQAAQPAQQQYDPNSDPLLAQFETAMENGDYRTVAAIQQHWTQQTAIHTAQQLAQQNRPAEGTVTPDVAAFIADKNLEATYPDWNEVKSQVGDIIRENPLFDRDELWSNPARATHALTEAYKLAKANEALSGNADQPDMAQLQRTMKLNAQTAVGAGGRPEQIPDDKAAWDRIMAARSKPYYEK